MKYVSELHGYLKALQRLCGDGFVFGVICDKAEDDIDCFVNRLISGWEVANKPLYAGYEVIESKMLFSVIGKYIFNGVTKKEWLNDQSFVRVTKMVIEDLNEYYGLISTSLDEKGVFYPLLEGPVYKLNITDGKFDSFYYLVKINEYFVVTYFKKLVEINGVRLDRF